MEHTMYLNPTSESLTRAKSVRAVIFDVDGCLTDGTLYYGKDGEEMKAFHVHDGFGIKQLEKHGIVVIIISGRKSPALEARVQGLGITHAVYGALEKIPEAERILNGLGLSWEQVAVMGDDWPDLPLFAKAGFTCAPQSAHPEVLTRAHFVTPSRGGERAARELCDFILHAQGHYGVILTSAEMNTLDNK